MSTLVELLVFVLVGTPSAFILSEGMNWAGSSTPPKPKNHFYFLLFIGFATLKHAVMIFTPIVLIFVFALRAFHEHPYMDIFGFLLPVIAWGYENRSVVLASCRTSRREWQALEWRDGNQYTFLGIGLTRARKRRVNG